MVRWPRFGGLIPADRSRAWVALRQCGQYHHDR